MEWIITSIHYLCPNRWIRSIGWLIDRSSDRSSIKLIEIQKTHSWLVWFLLLDTENESAENEALKSQVWALRLNDADHTAELVRRETVDVEAQLASLIVVHGSNRVFLVAVVDGSRRNFIFHCGVLLFPARFSRRSQRRNENCRQEKWRRIYINQSNDQAINQSINQPINRSINQAINQASEQSRK